MVLDMRADAKKFFYFFYTGLQPIPVIPLPFLQGGYRESGITKVLRRSWTRDEIVFFGGINE